MTVRRLAHAGTALPLALVAACSASSSSPSGPVYAAVPEPTLASDVKPVTTVAQAQPGVAIPYFQDCRSPLPGDTGSSPGGKVCTNVAVSGSTEAGKYFPDYGDCDVVRTQRPYQSQPAAGKTDPNDPRLADAAFMGELAWVTAQARASACTCCHAGSQAPHGAAEWDIEAQGIWTDTASNAAIGLFSGYADSTILGHFAPSADNGFERTTTGLPSTDAARMQAFWDKELARRGMTRQQAEAIPPFGAPLIASYRAAPSKCADGIGIDAAGRITWGGSPARYVYVLAATAPNPSLPPDGDLPDGTIWRLDVLASEDALSSGITYGVTPKGTFQHFPQAGPALALERGATYHLFVLEDIGLVSANCLLSF